MPSSFASAAAGQSSNRDTRGNARGESRGSGDWYVQLFVQLTLPIAGLVFSAAIYTGGIKSSPRKMVMVSYLWETANCSTGLGGKTKE
jgi:hypothetical protein